MKHILTLLTVLLLAPLEALHANELKLAGVFSDHMVLQRERAVPVWGSADPGEKVTVEFAGQKQSTAAGADGKWIVKLDAMKASDESRELTVQSEIADRQAKISDVLVGDVWVASGQSNMDWAIRMDTQGAEALARCADPGLRLYNVRVQGWMVCAPETLGGKYGWDSKGFSSLAYFFGAELRKNLKCPIGLIQATVGGSTCESWMDPAAIETLPNPSTYRGGTGGNFKALIAPIIPFGIRGVIWYQGEGNGEKLERAKEYALVLPRTIESWRKAWQQGDFPFLFVQLAAFGGRPEYYYPQLRESQQKALACPMTGMATAIDLGNPLDDIHPAGKFEVGRRLSLLARRIAYGEKLVDAGPIYSSMKAEPGRIRIAFTNTGSGLVTGEPVWTYNGKPIPHTEKVIGFEIAGADGRYIQVAGTIDGNEVLLSSPSVPQPVAARYGWAMCPKPQGNLYNKEGLPAFPFRTDTTGDMPVAGLSRDELSKRRAESFLAYAKSNIALNAKVSTSGQPEGSNKPELAVDGKVAMNSVCFFSGGGGDNWFKLDLGSIKEIESVLPIFFWDGDRRYNYVVEVSEDGLDWKQVADALKTEEPSTPEGILHRFAPVKARYVRLNKIKNSVNPSIHLVEVFVFPKTSAEPK